jgi:hypothetical protein
VRFLSDEERPRLLEACRPAQCPYLYTVVVLALSTGMRMLVRECVSDLVEHRDYPREARVAMLIHVLGIPWLQDKGPLTICGDFILAGGVIVATIERRARSRPAKMKR